MQKNVFDDANKQNKKVSEVTPADGNKKISPRHCPGFPLPLYPALQEHVYPPGVFLQSAFRSHLRCAHSFTSLQVFPSP